MKKYIHYSENKFFKISVSYLKEIEKPGYYMFVLPVKIERPENSPGLMLESFEAYSGLRLLLIESKRKSVKKYNQAVQLSDIKTDLMIDEVRAKNNIK